MFRNSQKVSHGLVLILGATGVTTMASKITPTRRRIKTRKEGEGGRQKCVGGKSRKEKQCQSEMETNMGKEGETETKIKQVNIDDN